MGLKSPKVRKRMEISLINSIQEMCVREEINLIKYERRWGRLFFHFPTEEIPHVVHIFRYIIGLHSFAPAFQISNKIEEFQKPIVDFAKKYIQAGDSFAIRARRVKPYPLTSSQIERQVGSEIHDIFAEQGNPITVNLTSPQKTIFIEIRQQQAYFYTQMIPTIWGGNPIEGDKPIIALWQDSLPSAMASMLMLRRGAIPIPVVMLSDLYPLEPFLYPRSEYPKIEQQLKNIAKFLPTGLPICVVSMDPLLNKLEMHFSHSKEGVTPLFFHILLSELMEAFIHFINHGTPFYFRDRKLWMKGILSPSTINSEAFTWKNQGLSRPYFLPLIGFDSKALQAFQSYYLRSVSPLAEMSDEKDEKDKKDEHKRTLGNNDQLINFDSLLSYLKQKPAPQGGETHLKNHPFLRSICDQKSAQETVFLKDKLHSLLQQPEMIEQLQKILSNSQLKRIHGKII